MTKRGKQYNVVECNTDQRHPPAERWVSGYEDLAQYLSDCPDEENVWDLAERIAEDAQGNCDQAVTVDDVYRILVCQWRGLRHSCSVLPVSYDWYVCGDRVGAALRYPGGKQKVLDLILAKRPQHFAQYREAFAEIGRAHV